MDKHKFFTFICTPIKICSCFVSVWSKREMSMNSILLMVSLTIAKKRTFVLPLFAGREILYIGKNNENVPSDLEIPAFPIEIFLDSRHNKVIHKTVRVQVKRIYGFSFLTVFLWRWKLKFTISWWNKKVIPFRPPLFESWTDISWGYTNPDNGYILITVPE